MHFLSVQGSERRATAQRERESVRERERGDRESEHRGVPSF